MSQDRFILVHYDVIARDPKFAGIREDDRKLGLWLRLLWLADAQWPQAAPVPSWASRAGMAALIASDLIALEGRHSFRVIGLDAERARRMAKGKPGADGRWGDAYGIADANADAIAYPNASPFAMRGGEGGREGDGEGGRETPSGPMAYYQATTRYPQPGSNLYRWITDLTDEFGEPAFAEAVAKEWAHSARLKDLMSRTTARLRMAADAAREATPAKSSESPEARRARFQALLDQGGCTQAEFDAWMGVA